MNKKPSPNISQRERNIRRTFLFLKFVASFSHWEKEFKDEGFKR